MTSLQISRYNKIRRMAYSILFCLFLFISTTEFIRDRKYLGNLPVSVYGKVLNVEMHNHALITSRFITDSGPYINVESGDVNKYSLGDDIKVYYLKSNPSVASYREDRFYYSGLAATCLFFLLFFSVIVVFIERNIRRVEKMTLPDPEKDIKP